MEENARTSPTLISHALKFGVILGIVSFVLTIILYVVDYTLLVDWKIIILLLFVYFGLAIFGGINYRNQIGGYLEYGKAFQHAFIVMAIAGVIGVLGNLVLYKVVDSELSEKLVKATIEKTEAMMKSFGAPEEKIDEQLQKLEEDLPNKFAMAGMLMNYVWGLITYAILSAITALIVRKRQPEVI